ncbi:Mitochondrial import inner membrane translocase subunit [Venturia nashicola]|uniref:Mitochondrial import inner membrane translocase subunit n=1 Tax=Venturia nashicola TaxID=86259 RepID=A0A4Z1NSL4_9PEZI|nr:Mitochondrial import inner membrane translocase subunit [Venturia nashicola]TLD23692.1 Mitochondrial import inner membrane translocase subunit [Venturia nashicola]
MSGTSPPQSRTPRASRHKHSKSAVPTAENEGANPGHTQHQKQNRQSNARKVVDSAWQTDTSTQAEGYFNDNGEFVMTTAESTPTADNPGYGSPQAQQSVGKRLGKKQPRNKNNAVRMNGNPSPQPARHQYEQQQMSGHINQSFSPHATTPAKPAAAYAGPTWNASPAPSALPMPKFYSKSMPQETSQASLQTRLDQESDESDKTDSPALAETIPAIPTPPRNDDSPLDFLFKKDKEQKAKRQSTGNGVLGSTPTRPSIGSFNTEPQRSTDWTSIYGTGADKHNRQGSNGSNKEQFMMELDGSTASPQLHRPSPRPVLNDRMSSAPSAVPQSAVSPYQNMHRNGQQPLYGPPIHSTSMPSLMANPGQQHPASRLPDASVSPFYHGPQQPLRSADTSPMPRPPTQHHQNLHYGNRNLGPLFQAAKQEPDRRASNLRQELHAELPDNGNQLAHRGNNGMNYQHMTNSDQAVRDYLLAQNPITLPKIDLPRQQFSNSLPRPESSELDAHSRPQSHNGAYPAPSGPNANRIPPPVKFNAKSVEDDLKRMLKLSLTNNSFDLPGVH